MKATTEYVLFLTKGEYNEMLARAGQMKTSEPWESDAEIIREHSAIYLKCESDENTDDDRLPAQKTTDDDFAKLIFSDINDRMIFQLKYL